MPSQHYPFAFQMTRDNVFQVGETVWAAEWGRGKGKGKILDKQGHSLWRGPPPVAQQSPPRVKQGPGPKKRVILGGSVPSRHATDYTSLFSLQGLPRWPVVKNPPANAEDMGLIPGSGRSPGGRNGNHSSILAWEIPWTEESGGLQSMGSQRVRHNWVIKTTTTFSR